MLICGRLLEQAGTSANAAAANAPKAKPSAEKIAMITAAIANATSLEEVNKLEKALKSGDYDAAIAATG